MIDVNKSNRKFKNQKGITMMINQANGYSEELNGQDLESVEAQYWVDLKDALDRLEKNDDFKRVILDGYFKDKAINGVSLLATDYIKQNGLRSEVMEALVAISNLEDYFVTIKSLGSQAPDEDEE